MSWRPSIYQVDIFNPRPIPPMPDGGVIVRLKGVAPFYDIAAKKRRQKQLVVMEAVMLTRVVPLRLERQKKNHADPNAMLVKWTDEVGYLPREVAKILAKRYDKGMLAPAAYAHSVGRHSRELPFGIEVYLYDLWGQNLKRILTDAGLREVSLGVWK